MSRPRSISDDQILEAARAVLLEQGIAATTADIARRAGISEGTIFRRYATKEELVVAALAPGGPPPFCAAIIECAAAPDPEADLVRIGTQVVAFFEAMLPRMHLLMSCHLHPAEVLAKAEDPPPVAAIRALTAWFDAAHRARVLDVDDCEIAARTFLGAMHQFAFLSHAGMHPSAPLNAERFVVGTVRLLLNGMLPRPHEGSP